MNILRVNSLSFSSLYLLWRLVICYWMLIWACLHLHEIANQLIESMDLTADPCDDFFQFACGGWIKSHPIPDTKSRWTQFDVLSDEMDLVLKGESDQISFYGVHHRVEPKFLSIISIRWTSCCWFWIWFDQTFDLYFYVQSLNTGIKLFDYNDLLIRLSISRYFGRGTERGRCSAHQHRS